MSLIESLSKIQRELHVPKSRFNAFGKYKYRNLEDIAEAVKGCLPSDMIVTLTDEIIVKEGWKYVYATATIHKGTDKLGVVGCAREAEIKKGMDCSQITGAASSYARKYAMCGLFAIDDGVDADSSVPPGKTAAMPSGGTGGGSFEPVAGDTITFGKYRGKTFAEVSKADLKSYAAWIKKQETGNPATEAFIKRVERL